MKEITNNKIQKMIEFEKMVANTPVSHDEYVQQFVDAVSEKFDNGLCITIDIASVKNQMKDIKFDIQGPVCSDYELMEIFKNADYLHIYNDSDDWLYGAIYDICNDYVMRCMKLIISKNK